jgi:hypothetical protein
MKILPIDNTLTDVSTGSTRVGSLAHRLAVATLTSLYATVEYRVYFIPTGLLNSKIELMS